MGSISSGMGSTELDSDVPVCIMCEMTLWAGIQLKEQIGLWESLSCKALRQSLQFLYHYVALNPPFQANVPIPPISLLFYWPPLNLTLLKEKEFK